MEKERCKTCGKNLDHPCLSHCSNECLFANLHNSKSVSGIPIEKWEEDEPWI